MKETILIVEDQFVEADYLRMLVQQAGYAVAGIARSVVQAREMIEKQRPGFVLLDIFLKGKLTGIDLARELTEENIPFVYLSANSTEDVLAEAKTTQPYGFLVKPFRANDLLVTLEIARYRHEHSVQHKDRRAKELALQLQRLGASTLEARPRLLQMAMTLQPSIPFDFLAIDDLGFLRIGFDEYQTIGFAELQTITGRSAAEITATPMDQLLADTFQLRSHLAIHLDAENGRQARLCLYGRKEGAYHAEQVALLEVVRRELTAIVSAVKPQATASSKALAVPRSGKDHEAFEGIIGTSHPILHVFDLLSQVAPSDTSVLILGESGTGKERIADAVHKLSPRAQQPLIKVNCATLPENLIESELFGHEKGAFTGAHERKIGKFEKANKGTIFLDEIGEMPIELQVKLLRVLQEKEIERLGGHLPINVDVRIIAATNKNLEKEVAEGRFRLDLYYRLNVFPIILPPLRDRKEDIPLLARHFVNVYSRKTGKRITSVADKVLKEMAAYDWPGNIRELEHLIERSVLLAKGPVIEDILLPDFGRHVSPATEDTRMKTIHENERDYILSVLRKCNGKIWGPGAAAEILNVPPSTLKSKMKKLGIKKEYTP